MSFILQNYNKTVPFLIKTKRYYLNIHWCGIFILNYFLKFITLYFSWIEKNLNFFHITHILFNKFFVKSTYKLYKKVFFRKFGLYTNLQTKSLITKILQNWINTQYCDTLKFVKLNSTIQYKRQPFFKYLIPISLSHISLKKKNYNIIIYYLINLLMFFYPITINNLLLGSTIYHYVPYWFFFYTFPRKYFFKIHSY